LPSLFSIYRWVWLINEQLTRKVGTSAQTTRDMEDMLPYKSFSALIHFSAEDGVFYGKVKGIDDPVIFEGCTVSELKKSFHEAVDDYLDKCRLLGKEPK
jgi:hypothetical protein